ncbi:MAG TPA: hypothetical protein ENN63_11840 [Bacteroidetes bacterium]|nr:hypothetical protein [Bacteroidota bacterium]
MKKYIFISLILSLILAIPAESQRRTAERSSSRKVESAARSNTRQKKSVAAKKSSNERSKAIRQASLNRSNQRSAGPRQTSRSSSSRQATVSRQSSRNNSSAARQANRSSSSSSSSAVRNRTNVVNSRNRETVQRRNTGASGNRGNASPARVENRNSGSRAVYRSSRRYVNRHPARHVYVTPPRSREYRAVHFPYRRPARVHVRWSVNVFRFYVNLYPVMRTWTYYPDYRFEMISAYNALFHIGELRTVYGKVTDTYYARETDEYFLYFGAYYPYHDFCVVLPGNIARRFSWNPERYFRNDYIMVTGLITEFEGKPEMVVKHPDQVRRY